MKVLITGGTGSLGSALSKKLIADGYSITVLSRDPHKQAAMRLEVPGARFVLCDICDYEKVRMACLDQDILIHAAALKIIQAGQLYPWEFSRVNIQGTETVIRAWGRTHAHLPHPFINALLISTDKAVAPINHYGATKMIAEHLWRNSGGSVLRYGNVVESAGSFLEVWKRRIENELPIIVRKPEPTRFFVTMDQALSFVQAAISDMGAFFGGTIYVPVNLRAFSVWEVAGALGVATIKEPLTPGEKQHEILINTREEARRASENSLLARVGHIVDENWSGWTAYISDLAPRMSGAEFWEAVKW